jgi:hypothetical protein
VSEWRRSVLVAALAIAVVVGAVVVWLEMRDEGVRRVRVTVTMRQCANPAPLRAQDEWWESRDIAPATWGTAESGELAIHDGQATFTSATDGRTVTFRARGDRFSTMPCLVRP